MRLVRIWGSSWMAVRPAITTSYLMHIRGGDFLDVSIRRREGGVVGSWLILDWRRVMEWSVWSLAVGRRILCCWGGE